MHPDSLLLSVPIPFVHNEGRLYFEGQAINGLRLWAENFSRVELIARESAKPLPKGWVLWDDTQPWTSRVSLLLVPEEFRPAAFLRAMPPAQKRFREAIARNRYLCFAIGGLFGDWGAVAAREAIRMGRPYSVWTDRVESEVVWRTRWSGSRKQNLKAHLTFLPMVALERYVIGRAELGLFHGMDTFDAYSALPRHPELVHDVHFSKDEIISPEDLAAKQAAIRECTPTLIYAGRMAAMKGWSDWLDVVAALRDRGMTFRAVWLGDGGDRGSFLRKVQDLQLSDVVAAPGNVEDRDEVRRLLEGAHGLLFCHKTKESPRILIEALRCGMPIIGYRSGYAADLVAKAGGGVLTTPDDTDELVRAILALNQDRAAWGALMGSARLDGEDMYDEAVFHHRSEVIKRALGRNVGDGAGRPSH